MEKAVSHSICPSCGVTFKGKYCFRCGEKKRQSHDFSIKHFIEESIEGFTHFDNKFFRTIKELFVRPGALTEHFEQGRRVPFMKPVQFFVICNLLFFLISGGFNVFTVPLETYLTYDNYVRNGTLETFNSRFSEGVNTEPIAILFNERVKQQSKAFLFLIIPFIAFAFFLQFFWRKRYFVLHLIFATHFFSFLLILFFLFGILIETPSRWFDISNKTFDNIALFILIPIIIIYLAVAIRRYYKLSWILASLSGIVISYVFVQLLQLYRIGLFYKIIYSINV